MVFPRYPVLGGLSPTKVYLDFFVSLLGRSRLRVALNSPRAALDCMKQPLSYAQERVGVAAHHGH